MRIVIQKITLLLNIDSRPSGSKNKPKKQWVYSESEKSGGFLENPVLKNKTQKSKGYSLKIMKEL